MPFGIGPFEQTLALRYLRGAEGRGARRFLRVVTMTAIGGVAVGTAALLLAMMIVRGFSREIETKIVGFGQHVQVNHLLGDPLENADSIAARIRMMKGVERVAPAVIDFALLRARPDANQPPTIEGVLLWGTRAEEQPFVSDRLTSGVFAIEAEGSRKNAADGLPGLVVGARIAEILGVEVGETITLFAARTAMRTAERSLAERPAVRVFRVTGVFETGLADFDERFAYANIETVRSLFRFGPDEATRIDVTLADIEGSREAAGRIEREVGPPALARSVYDVYRGLFAWVDLQQSIIPLVISILVLVAAFNIVGTLLMVVLEKTGEIGTVLAMGASRAAVRRLFLLLGMLIGMTGAALGSSLALAFGWVQARYEVIPLPQEAYYLDAAPVEIHASDVAWVITAAVMLCTLAAYLPARAAARVEPIRTIRFGG